MGITVLGTCSYCSGFTRADLHWNQVSPRAGFAEHVNNKTVVLGGFAPNHLDGGPLEFGTNKTAVNYGNNLDGIFTVSGTAMPTRAYGNWDTRQMPLPAAVPFTTSQLNQDGVLQHPESLYGMRQQRQHGQRRQLRD